MKGGLSHTSGGANSGTNSNGGVALDEAGVASGSDDATGGIWNQLPHDTNNTNHNHSYDPASHGPVSLKTVGQTNSGSSTVVSAAGTNGTLSPVLSRDFAMLLPSQSKLSKTESTRNDETATETSEGNPDMASKEQLDRGRNKLNPMGVVSPRLQSLKRVMVRHASEPNLPSDKKEKAENPAKIGQDPEKADHHYGQSLRQGRASEPQLTTTSSRLEEVADPHITIVGGNAAGGTGPGPQARLAGLLEPQKPLKPAPTWKTSAMNIIKYSWLNVLLVFVPVSFACANAPGLNDTVVFCVSFGAIIPLAALLGFATEELALRIGHTLGGLLNATLGNTVELIIAILALTKGELQVVQSSMIGSILSNCLLVLGCCFFAGGIRFHEQIYTIRAAQLNISLLGMSSLVFVIPAAFNASVTQMGVITEQASDNDILKISRGVAFLLLIVYAAYLFFQLWTHSYLYKAPARLHRSLHRTRTFEDDMEPQPPLDTSVLRIPSWRSSSSSSSASSLSSRNGEEGADTDLEMSRVDTRTTVTTNHTMEEEEAEEPKLKVYAAIILILVVTALTGLIAEYLVGSIDGIASEGNISKAFIGTILLPLVGNAAEHVTAVTVSVKDKLDLSLAVAVGSSIQIALFVIPLLVLLGWAIGQPLSLEFGVLETITLFVSIVIVNQAISDGKTNYLEGLALIFVYIVIALVFFFVPNGPLA